jgi:putative hydrolase of the HAD superfamily
VKVKGVCFDIDGTLYPKWVTNYKLLGSFFPSLSLAYRFSRFRKEVRTTNPRIENFRKYQARSIGATEKEIEKQFYDKWAKAFEKLTPYKDLIKTLELLKSKNLKLAVLSDFPIENKLKAMNVEQYFEFAMCSEDSGYLKPHPKPFLEVSEKLKLKPQEILFVGDSYDKDIIGSEKVGMKSAYIVPKRKKGKKGKKGDITFSTYKEFITLFETLFT